MSVSSRSTKAAMYSEIERLRELLDQRNNQIASLEEKVSCREAKVKELTQDIDATKYELRCSHLRSKDLEGRLADVTDQLSQQLRAEQPKAAPLSDRNTRHKMMKRLAITCKASVKWVDGQGFRQYKDDNWVAIPTHTVEFVAKGISQ